MRFITSGVYVKMLHAADGVLTAYRDDLEKHDLQSIQEMSAAGGDEFLWALRKYGTHFFGKTNVQDSHPSVTIYECCAAVHKTWEGRASWFLGNISTGRLRGLEWCQVENEARQWDRVRKKKLVSHWKGGVA